MKVEIGGKSYQVLNGPDGLYAEVPIRLNGKIHYIKKKIDAREDKARRPEQVHRDT